MKKIYLVIISCIFINLFNNQEITAQDIRVAQSYANPLRINPALMGINTDIKFMLNYRSQWASINDGYKTYALTAMYPIFFNDGKNKFDIGISTMGDKAGAFKTFDAALAVDYNQEIAPNNILCLSVIGGYVQQSLDLSKQTFDNQYVMGSYNPSNPTNESTNGKSESHPDIGFGFMWFLNPDRSQSKLNAYAGIAAYHLNRPNETMLRKHTALPMRFAYQGGVKIFGKNKIDISPNFRFNTQNGNIETATGLYVDYNFTDNAKFVIGAWYRTHDAIAFLLGFQHKHFTLGYSYDMVNSGINQVAPGANAHEITLSFKISRIGKAKSVSYGANENGTTAVQSVRTSPVSSF